MTQVGMSKTSISSVNNRDAVVSNSYKNVVVCTELWLCLQNMSVDYDILTLSDTWQLVHFNKNSENFVKQFFISARC